MRITLLTLVLTVIIVGCFSAKITRDNAKLLHHCQNICTSCGGTAVVQDEVCFCQLREEPEDPKCMITAKRKADFLGIEWMPVYQLTRTVRKTRPVRGSFLDPIIANVFEETGQEPTPKEDAKYNFIQQTSSSGRISKRSLQITPKSVAAPSTPTPGHKNEVLKRRVPRGSRRLRKSIMPEIASRMETTRTKRSKRSFAQMPIYNSGFETAQPNTYEILLEYPSSRESAGNNIQLLFPNTQGLDIEHEYYYQDSDYDDDEDDDCTDVLIANMMENQKTYGYPHSQNHAYNTDMGLRDVRSLWNRQEPIVCYYNLLACL